MAPALPIVRVAGPGRNVGKTWLASRLIAGWAARGYAVGAIKRSHHPVPDDRQGSDTDEFARAGATAVIFGASDGVLTRVPVPATDLSALAQGFAGRADVVVVEGFKHDALGAVAMIEEPARDSAPGRVAITSMDGRLLIRTRMDDVEGMIDALEADFRLSTAGDAALRQLIREASVAHGHRCAGIVLGARIGLAALGALAVPRPVPEHRLSVVLETAKCAADAIGTATGCSVGKRNLRVEEIGKLGAVVVDHEAGRAVRVAVRSGVRDLVATWAPGIADDRRAQEVAYRLMPDTDLLTIAEVAVPEAVPFARGRVDCVRCGEEVARPYAVPAPEGLVCRPCAEGVAVDGRVPAFA